MLPAPRGTVLEQPAAAEQPDVMAQQVPDGPEPFTTRLDCHAGTGWDSLRPMRDDREGGLRVETHDLGEGHVEQHIVTDVAHSVVAAEKVSHRSSLGAPEECRAER